MSSQFRVSVQSFRAQLKVRTTDHLMIEDPIDPRRRRGRGWRAPTPEAPPPAESSPDALQRERDDLYDRLLRKTAEFDNFRKRVERDRDGA